MSRLALGFAATATLWTLISACILLLVLIKARRSWRRAMADLDAMCAALDRMASDGTSSSAGAG